MIRAIPDITINSAFLQEIKDDNLQLYGLLDKLRAFWLVNDPHVLNPKWFSELMDNLRDQVAMHFTLENTFGYFERPVKFDSILSAEANRLRDQHIELYLQISSIAEKTEEMLYPKFNENIYVRQVEKFKEFYNAFQEHEAAEFTLIMSVLSGQQKRSRSPVSTYQEM